MKLPFTVVWIIFVLSPRGGAGNFWLGVQGQGVPTVQSRGETPGQSSPEAEAF